jgi:hypothetical protein
LGRIGRYGGAKLRSPQRLTKTRESVHENVDQDRHRSGPAFHSNRRPTLTFASKSIALLERFALRLLPFLFRFVMADVFWNSEQTKIASWQRPVALFANE